ncbi:hypothetical protein B7494_g4168 [Chlorociboria aeruginascens]|nr:hypothetical protein B7494_g4168 [Chlorociboria aeruginascens]
MSLISPRVHFYEINDQLWVPQYLREKVQSCLTLCWTFRAPILQKASPAQLVASTLYRTLSSSVIDYTYVDFCAGAGGPTPVIEKDLNSKLSNHTISQANGTNSRRKIELKPENNGGVKFVLTDLHPHIPDWTEAAKKSENLSFIAESVDAANAPNDLNCPAGKKVFRLYNLAFHHFDDKLGSEILKNTLENANGFGIFELQERTIFSFITVTLLWPLMLLISPFYFWRSPGHLFFTYIIPIIPFVLVFDGYVSSLRTRTAEEIEALMRDRGALTEGWEIQSGRQLHTFPTGYLTWVIGIKKR